MKLVNSVILSYMNFNIYVTKFTTAIHTNKPTRQISLCSLLAYLKSSQQNNTSDNTLW